MRKRDSNHPELQKIKQALREARDKYSSVENTLRQSNRSGHVNQNCDASKLQITTKQSEVRALITIVDALVSHLGTLSQTMDPFSQQFEDTERYMDIGRKACHTANQRIKTTIEVEEHERHDTFRN